MGFIKWDGFSVMRLRRLDAGERGTEDLCSVIIV